MKQERAEEHTSAEAHETIDDEFAQFAFALDTAGHRVRHQSANGRQKESYKYWSYLCLPTFHRIDMVTKTIPSTTCTIASICQTIKVGHKSII